jgi:hypothetical protein
LIGWQLPAEGGVEQGGFQRLELFELGAGGSSQCLGALGNRVELGDDLALFG